MNALEITITVRKDGEMVPGFPFTRRMEVDEIQGFDYEKPADNDTTTFSALPTSFIDTLQALIVKTDIPITLRLDAQSDAGIELNAGGLLVILDATIDAGANTNALVNNPDVAQAAVVKGLSAGT